jgi:Cysteine-rich domain
MPRQSQKLTLARALTRFATVIIFKEAARVLLVLAAPKVTQIHEGTGQIRRAALEDRAKKTNKAIAELLHTADVKFAVLGPAEACTGDPARRLGNEFVYQMLARQNIQTLNEAGVKKVVASCPHCFNTIAREFPSPARTTRSSTTPSSSPVCSRRAG